jgi:hypothetical protein
MEIFFFEELKGNISLPLLLALFVCYSLKRINKKIQKCTETKLKIYSVFQNCLSRDKGEYLGKCDNLNFKEKKSNLKR